MPKALESSLRKTARRRGYSKDREDRYVYGTLNKRKARKRKARKF